MRKFKFYVVLICLLLTAFLFIGCKNTNTTKPKESNYNIYIEVKNTLVVANSNIIKALYTRDLSTYDYVAAQKVVHDSINNSTVLLHKLESTPSPKGYAGNHELMVGLVKREIAIYNLLNNLLVMPYRYDTILKELDPLINEFNYFKDMVVIEGVNINELNNVNELIVSVNNFRYLLVGIKRLSMEDITFGGLHIWSKEGDVQNILKSTPKVELVGVQYYYAGGKVVGEIHKTYDEGIGLKYLKAHAPRENSSMAIEKKFINEIYIVDRKIKTTRGLTIGDSATQIF